MKNEKFLLPLLVLPLTFANTSCTLLKLIDDFKNNSEFGEDNFEITQETAKANMNSMKASGFEFTIQYSGYGDDSDAGTVTFGYKDNEAWLCPTEESDWRAVKSNGEKLDFYTRVDGEWSYEESSTELVDLTEVFELYEGLLTYGFSFDGSLVKKDTTAVIAGRTCKLYTCSVSLLVVTFSYNVYQDVESGLIFKTTVEASAEDETAGFSMEVTSFKTGSAVTAPVLPAAPVESAD